MNTKKPSQLLASALLILMTLITGSAKADIMFRPGPGLNDGSDNGSISAGKDSTTPGCLTTNGTSEVVQGLPRSSCNSCNEKGYIKFDVATLPAEAYQVMMGLEEIAVPGCFGGNCTANFYFYPLTTEWNEIALGEGLETPPPEGAAVLGPFLRTSIPPGTKGGLKEYDITPLYRGWKDGSIPNHGLVVYSPEGTCNNGAARFIFYSSDSSEPAKRPYLRVVAQPTISGLQLRGGNGGSESTWKPNGKSWNTYDDEVFVLGVSAIDNGDLINDEKTMVNDLNRGAYWLYAEPLALGYNPQLIVALTDGTTLTTTFRRTGTSGTGNYWTRVFGSDRFKLGWAPGVADKVGTQQAMQPNGKNDIYLNMLFYSETGGSVTGIKPTSVQCKNLTTGAKVSFALKSEDWNCETHGFTVKSGDKVQQIHTGIAK